jgi:hypothetical protein
MRRIWWILLALLGAPGCLLMADDECAGHVSMYEGRPGYTPCGEPLYDSCEPRYCGPNKYCAIESFGTCATGCLSNDNCAGDQRCVKSDGMSHGTCQNEIKRNPSDPRETMYDRDDTRGFTSCGPTLRDSVTCQPGQHCEDPRDALCSPGCLSDLNCTSDHRCEKEPDALLGACVRVIQD